MAPTAAAAGFIDFIFGPRTRALTVARVNFLGNLLAVLIEAYNWWHRYQVGPDAVASGGLIPSLVAVLILLVTGWLGGEMVYREHVGISDEGVG